jgi:hypothetical protein
MTSSEITTRLAALPRSIRWLVYTVTLIVMFYAWDASLGAVMRSWSEGADDLEAKAQTAYGTSEISERLDTMKDTIVALGPVTKPGREGDGRARLTNVVIEVLEDYRVDELSIDLSGGRDKLREDISRGIAQAGKRVTRLTVTLKFESSPEDAIAIVAALERHDDIEALRKVSITKVDSRGSRKVAVNLIAEAWVQVAAGRKRL